MVALQRSRGYSWRPPITIAQIREAVRVVKQKAPNCIFFVDNCYGEFVELCEPLEVGADLIAGSLIKNPGGSLAISGGYIVGRRELVELCAEDPYSTTYRRANRIHVWLNQTAPSRTVSGSACGW